MCRIVRSRVIVALIIIIGAAHGILVVGPKFIRPKQCYTVVISNFKSELNKVELMLKLEGNMFNVTKTVDMGRYMNRIVNFNIPAELSPGSYTITIDGKEGIRFHRTQDLEFLSSSISGIIQINKPIFKPGEMVKFRVIVLDTELRPPATITSVQVTILDPQRNVVRRWSTAHLYSGVFDGDLQILPTPMLGTWNIEVQKDEKEFASKTFEVKEYVLSSSFDVQITPTVIPMEKHRSLALRIAAHYRSGKPVRGVARIELYLEDNELNVAKEINMNGMEQVELFYGHQLELYNDQQEVRVKLTFIEHSTYRTVVKEQSITVFKYLYKVELIKDSLQFRPGHTFKCALRFRYHDDKPATGITGQVEVLEMKFNKTLTSDKTGYIKLELQTDESADEMVVKFIQKSDSFVFAEIIEKTSRKNYLQISLKSPIKPYNFLEIMVSCTEHMQFFGYYVVSKGNIIDAGYIRPGKPTEYLLKLNATERMIPKAKIIVVTVVSRTLLYDFLDIEFEELQINFDFRINMEETKPRRQIELSLLAQPGAYVGLAAYDKAFLTYSNKHDLLLEDVMFSLDEFHGINEILFDQFTRTGLFATTLDEITFDDNIERAQRSGHQQDVSINRRYHRKDFSDSWFWQNVTIGNSGSLKIVEFTPDTTTTWYMTGFAIDPVHGLSIIKKPIEIKTIKPFFIVESLPYSIKRGEPVMLQFMLFNNLGREYIADVTLHSVANQTEFIGRPVEDQSYTKSISVSPNFDVPVSFLIKARRIGEMVVRVSASIGHGIDTDALVKVVRVMPESLRQQKMQSVIFCSKSRTTKTFLINLDIHKQAEKGSKKISFRFNQNLWTVMEKYIKDFHTDSYDCGEINLVKLALNVVVIDYLKAIEFKEQHWIDQATKQLQHAYRKQMHCRNPDGSFGVRKTGRSVFLTSLAANALLNASKYIAVGTAVIEKSIDWLASQQHSSGRFDEIGSTDFNDVQAGLPDGAILTSYVLSVFVENVKASEKYKTALEKGMKYLTNYLNTANNTYGLSIATYARTLYGYTEKDNGLKKMNEMSTFTKNGSVRFWNSTNSDETTAYALMSYVMAGEFEDALPIMRWLVNRPDNLESFLHCHSTYVRFRALAMASEKMAPSVNDYNLQLKFKNTLMDFQFNSSVNDVLSYDDKIEDVRFIEVKVNGTGFGYLQMLYEYSVDLRNIESRFKLDLEKQNMTSDYELKLKVCVSFIPGEEKNRTNLTMIEITFPSGYGVDRNPISEESGVIKNFEIRFSSTSVVVYYDNMGIEKNCFTVTAYRRFKAALKRPAYVVVYDYYNSNLNAIKEYVVD